MTIRLSVSSCLFHLSLSVILIAVTTPVAAQSPLPTAPACPCGPSALPEYVPPYPKPALRPLDGSVRSDGTVRSGVTYRQGVSYREARTHLGTSAHEPIHGPALWSGLYLGAHGGYGSGKAAAGGLGAVETNGGFGGVHLGRNWQSGALVAGLEGDVSRNGSSAHRTIAAGVDLSTAPSWSGSLRGRIGYAFGNVLAYGTAGVAVAGQSVTATTGGTTFHRSKATAGYVYGAGIAWQILPQVSVHGEVLHYDFNATAMSIGGAQSALKIDETVIRGGLSFRFN